jgi:hypothetical protein
MSTPFLVVIPIALLAIVVLLSFVGCDDGSLTLPATTVKFSKYSGHTILPTPGLVAYWTLDDTGGTTAKNRHQPGTSDGTFKSAHFPADPNVQSAEGFNTLTFGSLGLLDGDLVQPANTTKRTCIGVNGGYVVVPWSAALNPLQSDGFTIEAWVKVGWGISDTAAHRAVLVSQFVDPSSYIFGFALYATPNNCWEVSVGTPAGPNSVQTITSGQPFFFGATYYLAATYDPNALALTLYVEGRKVADVQTSYDANWTGPLYIGVGPNQLPNGPENPTLIYPFVGGIQAVAVYKGALSADTIFQHCRNGNGWDP